MRNKVKMRQNFVEKIFFSFGTIKEFANKAGLSSTTVSQIMHGGTAGRKARENFVKALNSNIDVGESRVSQMDVFYVERPECSITDNQTCPKPTILTASGTNSDEKGEGC